MEEEYEWKEFADDAVSDLREFIVAEDQIVQEEHELEAKLNSWDYISGHLNELISEGDEKLISLSGEITQKLLDIRNFVETELSANIQIIKEEAAILEKLESAVAHREWRVVKSVATEAAEEEKKAQRLKQEELRTFHKQFIELMKVIKRAEDSPITDEDLTKPKEKSEFENAAHYFMVEVYKFARAYEQILRKLWEKERLHIKA